VISCHELARLALGYEVGAFEAAALVRPHISRLRKKIEPDPAHPQLVRTIPGKGYGIRVGTR
jgi:DNA-binding response OmpR family regulator